MKESGNEKDGKPKPPYHMKGIPLHAYLTETGDFQWIPTPQACAEKEDARTILEVLKKMPEDRRQVWASRLDTNEIITTCPIINKEPDLCEQFDEFCQAYNPLKLRKTEGKEGGERSQ